MSLDIVNQRLGVLTAWIIGGLAFIFVFTLTVIATLVWQASITAHNTQRLREVAITTHDALCSLRADLVLRHKSSAKFLIEHPEGLLGENGVVLVSAASIKQSVEAQAATINALDELECN